MITKIAKNCVNRKIRENVDFEEANVSTIISSNCHFGRQN